MDQMIFVNLPITDVARSRAFYQALGFGINEQFSDDTTACVIISDVIHLMILERGKFATYAPKAVSDPARTTGALIALSQPSKEAVDAMVDAAVAAGGTDNNKVQDIEGFMYNRSFCDPDGHVFEPMWMNPDAVTAPEEEDEA